MRTEATIEAWVNEAEGVRLRDCPRRTFLRVRNAPDDRSPGTIEIELENGLLIRTTAHLITAAECALKFGLRDSKE